MSNLNEDKIEKIKETLSPIERKITPYLTEEVDTIVSKSGLDLTTVLRALDFMQNKDILKIKSSSKTIVDLGLNGIFYKKNGLPERKLLFLLENNKPMTLEEAQRESKLSENEFKVSLGVLKRKALINLVNGKVTLNANKEELTKKSPEEKILEILPIEKDKLAPEQLHAFENLKNRKDIIEIKEKKTISFELTDLGKSILGKNFTSDLIEEVTPEVIKNWNKNKKFRRYDISAPVPKIFGGKKHFVNQAIEQAKKVWIEMGFKEMQGHMVDTSFWIFDSLYTPQDHQAREMQDTFFLKGIRGKLPDAQTIKSIKESHEKGISGSKGWNYTWKNEEAEKVVLRTHTTGISARTLSSLKNDIPAKYFTIGKVFRNETVDWSHGFEFYQTEGIVIDKNANFRHLLHYLKEFYKKMGYDKIKFVPSFFPYTEPSVEMQYYHPERKIWVELGGAGMLRPEVVVPLLGKYIPVLAWGQGFDRIIMENYDIKDLREMYSNNLKELKNKKVWIR